jgi:oligopeptide/dipeptide ABC transporter ATP-binding protein
MGSTEEVYYNPLHPYTRMLMACVPRLDEKWQDVDVELKAQQSGITSGCVYYERCQVAGKDESCATERPALIKAESDHYVACGQC